MVQGRRRNAGQRSTCLPLSLLLILQSFLQLFGFWKRRKGKMEKLQTLLIANRGEVSWPLHARQFRDIAETFCRSPCELSRLRKGWESERFQSTRRQMLHHYMSRKLMKLCCSRDRTVQHTPMATRSSRSQRIKMQMPSSQAMGSCLRMPILRDRSVRPAWYG